MKTPIETLLEAVEWKQLPPPVLPDEELYATHEGTFILMGCVMKCYTLSNGQRVFDAESLRRFFGVAGD